VYIKRNPARSGSGWSACRGYRVGVWFAAMKQTYFYFAYFFTGLSARAEVAR
jgi:hypothetical protein